ncbi:chitobiase/beta-hexosaminidase C-terminal domain-containing protein [Eubacteriales bacterium OttesenSCG-928-A19]|nr:chitobiase/beta-hexosaminidase C-terminal domain-containing protein [Eubacteriales bacterium OttesenSCG-928-A19]
MTCWRCGGAMESTQQQCDACGAQRPASRRHRAQASASAPAAATGSRDAGMPPSRRASASRGSAAKAPSRQQTPPADAPRRPRSMPPTDSSRRTAATPSQPQERAQPRMVRRHTYEAIRPQTHGYDHVNWLRLCIIAVCCVVLLCVGIYLYLKGTSPGQRWLAANGREATTEAYHEVGRQFMSTGSISRAIWALEIAQSRDPESLEILIDLGKAYSGNNQMDEAELAFSKAIQDYEAHPDAYRLLANIMLDQGRNYEALQLVEMAMENSSGEFFETLHTQLLPSTPSVSQLGGRFEKEEVITLSTDEKDGVIYYTLDGEDPKESGILYQQATEGTKDTEGTPAQEIQLLEGGWRLRAVVEKNGMYSKEQSQYYTVVKPSPDMPRSSLAPGKYDAVKNVSLRATGIDTIAIYYTTDGTEPVYRIEEDGEVTINGRKFEEPITLRIGKTELRAIAVNSNEKVSNVLTVIYECGGRTKTTMTEVDVIDNLKLFETTRSKFEAAYGAPQSEQPDGVDGLGEYIKLNYSFGYATFLDTGREGREPVLVELSTTSTAFTAPRGTRVGMRMDDVIAEYRDDGGEERTNGDRLLYSRTDGRIGMYTKLSETEYKISYYFKQTNGQFMEISYYTNNGLVERIEWLQYDPA